MSQEKVNRYKEEKANRKKNLVKQKQQKTLKAIGGVLGSILLIVAIIFSAKLLRGDFNKEEPSSYSEEYLQQIRDLMGVTTSSDTESGENETTTPAQ
ncbi:MAG: hypothetical protein ACLRVQ_07885 [Lachnospiraceae bacterium]